MEAPRLRSLPRLALLLLPHGTFRLFAFWMVLLVHGNAWSARISLTYYATLFACALLPGRTARCTAAARSPGPRSSSGCAD